MVVGFGLLLCVDDGVVVFVDMLVILDLCFGVDWFVYGVKDV